MFSPKGLHGDSWKWLKRIGKRLKWLGIFFFIGSLLSTGLYLLIEYEIAGGAISYVQRSARKSSALEVAQDLYGIYCAQQRHSRCGIRLLSSTGIIIDQVPTIQIPENEGLRINFHFDLSQFEPVLMAEISMFPSASSKVIWVVAGGLFCLFFFSLYLALDESTRRKELRGEIEKMELRLQAESAQARIGAIASQVSHDIRSPLSALNMVVASLKELPEDKRLIIRNAAQRINDIANGLLQQSKKSVGDVPPAQRTNMPTLDTPAEPQMLVALLDAIVSEKRIQYRERMEVEILADLGRGYGLFARINPVEFARLVSNLVNNSVEALTGSGHVTVAIRGYKDHIAVIVSDNGKGIPPDVLAHLGERGMTHGKTGMTSGSGLGLHHARETAKKTGGKFSIQSQVGVGTQVTLTLPRAETPTWFVEKIVLPVNATIVSLDDDQTIHQIWVGRLSSAGSAKANVRHIPFSSLEQFATWVSARQAEAKLFLVDYEFLAQSGNGLDAIERAGIARNAILVTSRYEEPHVRARAEVLGVRILPKALVPFVPLTIEKARERLAAVLIDDDVHLVHLAWQLAAKEKGVNILCFATAEEFWARAAEIDLATPLFIDVSLANGVRGEEVAREIMARGFTDVSLATGYAPDSVTPPPGLRGVVGKDPAI